MLMHFFLLKVKSIIVMIKFPYYLLISLKKGWYWNNVYFICCNFSVVILEHSEDGPDWRDFVFATSTYIVDSKRFETSLHKFSLSKDIVHVTQAAAAASQEGWKKQKQRKMKIDNNEKTQPQLYLVSLDRFGLVSCCIPHL